jgi:chromate transporter
VRYRTGVALPWGIDDDATVSDNDNSRRGRRVNLPELFFAFSWLGLSSFGGGVPAWIHRAFVERRRLLSEREFAARFTLARIMPGTNVVNLAVLVGYRARGAFGAAAAALGLLLGPTLVSIGLVMLYDRFAGSTLGTAVVKGAAAGAAGLLIAMAINAATPIVSKLKGRVEGLPSAPFALLTGAAVFVLVGIVQISTLWVVLCCSPISIAFFFLTSGSSSARTGNGRR